jgi:hypothetical protein
MWFCHYGRKQLGFPSHHYSIGVLSLACNPRDCGGETAKSSNKGGKSNQQENDTAMCILLGLISVK